MKKDFRVLHQKKQQRKENFPKNHAEIDLNESLHKNVKEI